MPTSYFICIFHFTITKNASIILVFELCLVTLHLELGDFSTAKQ